MNNDLKQFSEERLKDIVEFRAKPTPLDGVLLARIALAAKQTKPVGYLFVSPDGGIAYSISNVDFEGVKLVGPIYSTPQPAHTEQDGWIKCSDRIPDPETPVLIMNNGNIRIGEIRWDHPTHEESYQAFTYWDDPYDDGQLWEIFDVTHWMPLPAAPKLDIAE